MTRSLGIAAVLLAGCAVLATAITSTTPESEFMVEEEEDVYVPFAGERFDDFDWLLCKALDKREAGNVVVSPIGIKLVLAMLYEGAAGITAREIQTTVRFRPDRQQLRRNFSSILASLQQTQPEYVLDIGSKLYADERILIHKNYNEILKTHYNSEVEAINFANAKKAAAQINSWVDSVTHGRIQNLVSDAESMSSTVMLLVNAIFFKGMWRYSFNPEETAIGRFQSTRDKSVAASYMKLSHILYHMDAPDIDSKIVRLPYMGKKYAMFIVLPNSPTGLKHLVNTINPYILRRHMWLMNNGTVNVTLPKFNFKYASDVTDVLKELGINELFKSSASLPSIVRGTSRLYVSDVLQKAGLAVDEQGTEAYAATDVTIGTKFGDTSAFVFNATHPFMFFIEDETTGTVIFVGKVIDPSNFEPTIPSRPVQPVSSTRRPATSRPSTWRPVVRPRPSSTTASPGQRRPISGTSEFGSGNTGTGNNQRPEASNVYGQSTQKTSTISGSATGDEGMVNAQPASYGGNIGNRVSGGDDVTENRRPNDTVLAHVWKEVFSHRVNN